MNWFARFGKVCWEVWIIWADIALFVIYLPTYYITQYRTLHIHQKSWFNPSLTLHAPRRTLNRPWAFSPPSPLLKERVVEINNLSLECMDKISSANPMITYLLRFIPTRCNTSVILETIFRNCYRKKKTWIITTCSHPTISVFGMVARTYAFPE